MVIEKSVANQTSKTLGIPFELEPSAVSAWLDKLPDDDKMESSKSVYSTLQSLNRLDIDIGLRFQILELFRPVLIIQSAYLESYITVSEFPLPRKLRKIAKLTSKLHSELATGYKIIAGNSMLEEFSTFEQASVIHRALQSISHSLLRISQMSEPHSPKLWSMVKSFYRQAREYNLLDIVVHDDMASASNESTISNVVIKTALFSVSNPYSYTQTEMDSLFRLLELSSEDLDLQQQDFETEGSGTVVINLNDANSPALGVNKYDIRDDFILHIKLEKMFEKISAIRSSSKCVNEDFGEKSLSRLMHHLGKPDSPDTSNVIENTEISVGMDEIVSSLCVETALEPVQRENATSDWINSPDFELIPLDNLKMAQSRLTNGARSASPSVRKKTNVNLYQKTAAEEIWGKKKSRNKESNRILCDVLISGLANHILVELDTNDFPIGEIIACNDPRVPLQLGITRWKQPTSNERFIYYGVEKLAENYSLVDVFLDTKKYRNSLLLQTSENQRIRYSILLPAGKYRSGARMTVKQSVKTINFKLEMLLEISPSFCHYSLVICKPLVSGS